MTLAIQNRFSLSDLGEDWSDCNLLYSKATYTDLQELAGLEDSDDKVKQVEFMLGFVKKHVTGGQVLELHDGKSVLVDFKPEHIDELPRELIDKLFAAISGVSMDPKGEEPTVAPSSTDTQE